MNDEMTWAEKIKYIFDKKKELPGGDKMSDKMDKCIKFVSADNDKKEYEVEVKIEKWMENPRNELHGGVCCTFLIQQWDMPRLRQLHRGSWQRSISIRIL